MIKKTFKLKKLLYFFIILIYGLSINVVAYKPAEALQTATEQDLVGQVRQLVNNYYYKPVTDEVLNSSSIEALLKNLGDPYSSYFTKAEFDDFVNSIDNKFTGIGIQFRLHSEGVEIVSVMDGSPAMEAGLKNGDVILKADDKILKGISEEQVGSYIKGVAGTNIKLLIKRENTTAEYNIIRREISMPTVVGKELPNHIGYIEISSFGDKTGEEFSKILDDLNSKNVESYIIDLRYNPGGYVNTALDIGGHFVGFKPVVQMEDRAGQRYKYYGTNYSNLMNKPTIFLINDYSASASEILSAAMKDYKKASFIGMNTYGKGVAQNMFYLSDYSVLKLTTSQFFSPLNKTINKIGIKPDIEVNDEEINSLDVAKLILADASDYEQIEALKDKSSYVKVILNGLSYYINLKEARKDENWESFKKISDKIPNSNIYAGIGEKWVSFKQLNFTLENEYFYPDSTIVKDTIKSKDNKVITLTFNKPILYDKSIYDNIELINSSTGERIGTTINIYSNKVKITANNEWKAGQDYYLLLHKEIKDYQGKAMGKDILSRIVIK